ncbi:Gfo/Idh/MocA family protein [Kaistia algarum]|uniref:Gfo/Idh/MocA family protein n=1 Tax=Kaistia algarum TaxID=2083279 RepID=UPI00140260AB|nr:Gfo/Idh/MocA family oxidoreductase [Kaistia algarum]MCX5515260.1 Gfo/Idh/MocA family oxidoreductase [Kaistia algarum]
MDLSTGGIRTGVVGLGYFGSFHARHHAANAKSRLVGVVDADSARADAAAATHGAQAFSDHRDLIGRVDAVSITVPTSLHHGVAGDFLDAGVHVLIEKPIAHSPEAARDLIARAKASGAVLQIGHIERFSPVFGLLKQRVVQPRHIECVRIGPWRGRAVDVDVVLDLMIHDIDLVLSLVASPVESVDAVGSPVLSPTNDFAHAQLRFANGTTAHLSASRVAERTERAIRLVEPDRYWTADMAERTVSSFSRTAGLDSREAFSVPPSDNLALEIDSFLDAVATTSRPLVDGKAGLDALMVAEAILRSIAATAPAPAALAIGGSF